MNDRAIVLLTGIICITVIGAAAIVSGQNGGVVTAVIGGVLAALAYLFTSKKGVTR